MLLPGLLVLLSPNPTDEALPGRWLSQPFGCNGDSLGRLAAFTASEREDLLLGGLQLRLQEPDAPGKFHVLPL